MASNLIEIKLTKFQKSKLAELQEMVETAYKNDERGAIVAQFFPDYGTFKCGFYNHKEITVFTEHFREISS